MSHPIEKGANLLLSGVFCAAVAAPVARWGLTGTPDKSVEKEQRAAEPWPTFSLESAPRQAFPRAFERWFDDRFPFRTALLQLHNVFLWSVAGSIPDDSMVRGKQGWLFLAGNEAMGLYRGHDLFEPKELDRWVETYSAWHDWLAARDCLYLLLLGPDKQGIYPEFLPDWVRREGPITRVDQFFEALRERTEIPVLDVRQRIFDHKQDGLLYYQHGTHWNDRGAWYAYLALIDELAKSFPIERPLPRSAFKEYDRHLVEQAWVADTWFERWHLEQLITQEAVVLEYQPQLTWSIVEFWQTPARMLDGRTKNTMQFLPKAVLLRDSYGEWLWPLLAHHFRELVSDTWSRFPVERIEKERPDVVIQVRVERFLMAPVDALDLGPSEIQIARDWNRAVERRATIETGGAGDELRMPDRQGQGGLLRLEFEPGAALSASALVGATGSDRLVFDLPEGRRFVFLRLPAWVLSGAPVQLDPQAASRLLSAQLR